MGESFLERNSWLPGVVVAIVLFITGTAVTLYLRRRDKESKTFDYRVISDLPILLARPDNELKVTYMNHEVQNPRMLRVRFVNTGKQVIKAADFLNPYFIRLEGSQLLNTAITEMSAEDLADFAADGQKGWVQLTIKTLNPGDSFTVQMIVDNEDSPSISISGRIEGETRKTAIYPTKSELTLTREWFNIGLLVGLAFMVLSGLTFFGIGNKPHHHLAGAIGVSSGVVIIIISAASWHRSRQRLLAGLGRDQQTQS